jgi:hypothetical protein
MTSELRTDRTAIGDRAGTPVGHVLRPVRTGWPRTAARL